jgi:hypothetical protein
MALALKAVAALLALVYLANGARMLWDPAGWYDAVPGITASGPMNPHFIRDIGFVYLLSGLAFARALTRPGAFALWAGIGAAWPALHGLFHLAEWLDHGLPQGAALAVEGLGVVLPAVLGVAIALAARHCQPRSLEE